MIITGETEQRISVSMQISDVTSMLTKAGLVPVTFSNFWRADIKADADGGLTILFVESSAMEVPKLGKA